MSRPPVRGERVCDFCGEVSVHRKPGFSFSHAYCSYACSGKGRGLLKQRGQTFLCGICQKPIYKRPSAMTKRGHQIRIFYCCKEHQQQSMKKRIDLLCAFCKLPFNTQPSVFALGRIYCSSKCRDLAKKGKSTGKKWTPDLLRMLINSPHADICAIPNCHQPYTKRHSNMFHVCTMHNLHILSSLQQSRRKRLSLIQQHNL